MPDLRIQKAMRIELLIKKTLVVSRNIKDNFCSEFVSVFVFQLPSGSATADGVDTS